MPDRGSGGLGRKLLWFAGLWLTGLGTVSLVAYVLRSVIL